MNKICKTPFWLFEKIVVKANGWKHLEGSENQMIYIDLQTYTGPPLKIHEGFEILPGDSIAELHVDNLKVGDIEQGFRTISKLFIHELQALSQLCSEEGEFCNVKAFHGTTILYPIAKKFGFSVIDVKPTLSYKFIGFWDRVLKNVFSNNMNTRNKKGDKRKHKQSLPKQVWIDKETLLAKYLKNNN